MADGKGRVSYRDGTPGRLTRIQWPNAHIWGHKSDSMGSINTIKLQCIIIAKFQLKKARLKFKASLGYIRRPYLTNLHQNQKMHRKKEQWFSSFEIHLISTFFGNVEELASMRVCGRLGLSSPMCHLAVPQPLRTIDSRYTRKLSSWKTEEK